MMHGTQKHSLNEGAVLSILFNDSNSQLRQFSLKLNCMTVLKISRVCALYRAW